MSTQKIILIIIGLSVVSIFTTSAYGQTLYVDSQLGELKKIDESKYIASALTVITNSNGEIISVVETKATRYLSDPITEQYLQTLPIIKKGVIDGKEIKMMQVEVEGKFDKCTNEVKQTSGYIDSCNLYNRPFVTSLVVSNDKNETFEIFRGLNHGYILQQEYNVKTFWTIISRD
tara:strand:+ start:329 stop:853 length:525 start_codon:yes stop_codon:yes gene_type:complete